MISQLRILIKTKNFTESKYFFVIYIRVQNASTLRHKISYPIIFCRRKGQNIFCGFIFVATPKNYVLPVLIFA